MNAKKIMKNSHYVEWILRLGIAATFLGHGVFALTHKASWFKYFLAVGITEPSIPLLLTLIGIMDVAVAIFMLVKPYRAVLAWAVLWGFLTALIRPISGEQLWEFVERAANFAAPLALLAYYGIPRKLKEWLK